MKKIKTNYVQRVAKWEYNPWQGRLEYETWGAGRYHLCYKTYGYRYIKTGNERRQNSAAMDDGIYVRGKRRKCNLPTVWDDPRVGRHWGRSWKDYTKRRNQWG